MSDKRRSGGCLCGAVRFNATLKNTDVGICHCGMCRRWTGVFMAVEIEPDWEQTGTREPAVFDSSQWGQRFFCPECGTSIGYRMRDGSYFGLAAGTFDDPEGFRLTSEIFIDKKPDFYAFANETHKLTQAEFLAEINQQRD